MALGPVEPIVVRGNASLLREALVELLENACRHGVDASPITVSVSSAPAATASPGMERPMAIVQVASATPSSTSAPGSGLGHRIVRWIMAEHDGTFDTARDADGQYLAQLVLPR